MHTTYLAEEVLSLLLDHLCLRSHLQNSVAVLEGKGKEFRAAIGMPDRTRLFCRDAKITPKQAPLGPRRNILLAAAGALQLCLVSTTRTFHLGRR